MGWRGMLRSMQAADRRAARGRERHARAIERVERSVGSLLSKLSTEIEGDIEKVRAYEEKLVASPVRAMGLEYGGKDRWEGKPYEDRKGQLQFSLTLKFTSDPVTFTPEEVDLDGFRIRPVDCCITHYATYLAFSVTTSKGSAKLDLVKPSSPEDGRMALMDHDGQVYWAIDESLDGRVLGGAVKEGIIAFEPFSGPVDWFDLVLLPKETKKEPDPEPVRISARGPAIPKTTGEQASRSTTLVERFAELARAKEEEVQRQVQGAVEDARRQSAGCLSMALIGPLALILARWVS